MSDAATTQYRTAVQSYRTGDFVRAHLLAACLDGRPAKKLARMALTQLAGSAEAADEIEAWVDGE